MAIFAVGANYDGDVSGDFIANSIAGPGWDVSDAPELHQFIRSLKVGDIIYIKSFSQSSPDIIVKAIGVITDDQDITTSKVASAGRNIKWIVTDEFRISNQLKR